MLIIWMIPPQVDLGFGPLPFHKNISYLLFPYLFIISLSAGLFFALKVNLRSFLWDILLILNGLLAPFLILMVIAFSFLAKDTAFHLLILLSFFTISTSHALLIRAYQDKDKQNLIYRLTLLGQGIVVVILTLCHFIFKGLRVL